MVANEDISPTRAEETARRSDITDAINKIFKETLTCETEEDVARTCLRVAEELTGSRFGFICEIGRNERLDTLIISDSGWSACGMKRTEPVLKLNDLDIRGIRSIPFKTGKAFLSSDPTSHPQWLAPPEGHPEITSFMGIPLGQGRKIIGLIGLANKPQGYNRADQETVEALSTAFMQSLFAKRAEHEIHNYMEQLEAANRELEAFSYSVSHDLRAPLRAIQGFSTMLLEECSKELSEEGRRYLGVINDETRKMAYLIDDLLSLSRVGRQGLRPTRVQMNYLVGTVIDELRKAEPERDVEFDVKRLPSPLADRTLLRQVFLNLIANAMKYTRGREPAMVEIGCQEKENENIYYVKDNGIGFNMKYAHKLFGVFQRLHSADEFEGTGVGLATVQRIIHRHGGRVWAEGSEGEGVTFYFALPRGEKE